MVYVMCFTDSTQESHYELSTMKPEEWEKANPTLHLVYAFRKEDELIYGSQCEKDNFMSQCGRYGFAPEDYQKVFRGIYGDELMLIGFISKNRKYKCKLKNINTGRMVKATVKYVKDYMNAWPIN